MLFPKGACLWFRGVSSSIKCLLYFPVTKARLSLSPPGNVYHIENMGGEESVLYFAQGRKVPEPGASGVEDLTEVV